MMLSVKAQTRSLLCSLLIGCVAVGLYVDTADARQRRSSRARQAAQVSRPIDTSSTASIVVDGKTGTILQQDDADSVRFPASITKVMTLFLLFDELERGTINMNTPLTVSALASRQAPSKLGLRPGETIEVEDAIKAIVTKSANDVAVVIAENLAPSQEDFAERMTRKARAIGMSRTVFRNASGLPNPGQFTTARDLAVMGRAIQDQHPKYFRYFATRSFAWRGRVIGNHNRLLGRVQAVDGIKTGYINASGFNLLTSAKDEGREIVAVVLGGRTGAARDAQMKGLVEAYLPRASGGRRTAPLIADAANTQQERRDVRPAVIASAPVPVAAPMQLQQTASVNTPMTVPVPTPVAAPVPATTVAAKPAPLPVAAVRSEQGTTPSAPSAPAAAKQRIEQAMAATTTPAMRWVAGPQPTTTGSVETVAYAEPSPVAAPSSAPVAKTVRTTTEVFAPTTPEVAAVQIQDAQKPQAAEQPVRPIQMASIAEPAVPEPEPTPTPVAVATQDSGPSKAMATQDGPARRGWFIQIGATDNEDKALELLDRARSKAGSALARAESFTESVVKGEQTLYRARFAGFDEKTAQAACTALKRSAMSCFAIKN